MGTPNDAEYFRQRRRKQGITPRDDNYLYSAATLARGREIAMMERLPMLEWPATLFEDVSCHKHYVASATKPIARIDRVTDDRLCGCGCNQPHNHAVSRVVEDSGFGSYGRRIVWYRTTDCRNKYMGFGKMRVSGGASAS